MQLIFTIFFSFISQAALADFSFRAIDDLVGTSKNALHSIQFVRVSDGKVLYEKNSSSILCPASVTKILVGAAAFHLYGPPSTIKTQFYLNRANGDLIAVGAGDPFLISEKLWQMAADVKNMGIKEISGNIIIDNSLFDGEARDFS